MYRVPVPVPVARALHLLFSRIAVERRGFVLEGLPMVKSELPLFLRYRGDSICNLKNDTLIDIAYCVKGYSFIL
jgi:hypothetical protein